MIYRHRALSAISLAALALCAVLAPAASADFESESSSPGLSRGSNAMQSFKTSSGSESTFECTTFSIDGGTLSGTATTTVEIDPTYSSCEDWLGQSLEVDEEGCSYVLHLSDNSTEGTVDVECPTSTGIQFTVGDSFCKYEIDSQTGLGTIKYVNKGTSSTREIELQPSVTSITIVRTKDSFLSLCPSGSSTGTYTGNSTLTGVSPSGHVGIFVD
jgi:hypothetical protein